MKYFILILLIITSKTYASEFRGYVEVNESIRDRIIDPKSNFEIASLLGLRYNATQTNLLDLLGTYKATDVSLGFKNGQPNSLNMLVWKLLFGELSNNVSNLCIGADSKIFADVFKTQVLELCKWPDAQVRNEASLEAFWFSLMSYDAPQEEFFAFRDFFMSEQWTAAQPNDAVWAMTYSILMNPYFLLKD